MRSNAATSFPRVPAALVAVLVALSLGAGCHSVPRVPGAEVEVLYRGTLEEVRPVDVVVAPIRNSSGSADVPEAMLRRHFVDGLVKRRYSPLALEYVDRQVVEASYAPGSLREDAVLQVEVVRWDTSLWETQGVLDVSIEAWMLDASRPGRAELWGGRLDRRMQLTQEQARYSTRSALHDEICERLASRLLEAMPARVPSP